jgi:hypothetical protein
MVRPSIRQPKPIAKTMKTSAGRYEAAIGDVARGVSQHAAALYG